MQNIKASIRTMNLCRFILYLIFLFQIFSESMAQNKDNIYSRSLSDTLDEKYKIDISKLREHIYAGLPPTKPLYMTDRKNLIFADNSAFYIGRIFNNGLTYFDWPELEDYTNNILKNIIPEELKSDSTIRAYIIKDGNYNAFMTPSGQMFINIGVFGYIYDESTLAALLAHELAHYYLLHGYKTYVQEITNWSLTAGGIFDYSKEESSFSIALEEEADSLAIEWIKNSPYKISGVLKSLNILQRLETNLIRKSKTQWRFKNSTHPISEDRLEKLKNYINKNTKNEIKGKDFLYDSSLFFELHEKAKIEILSCLLNNYEYNLCIESAFRFHLFDSNNSAYIYYLLESIRRLCYLDSGKWKKNFITSSYYYNTRTKNDKKIQFEEGIFEKLDLEILRMSPSEIQNIETKFYWKDQPRKFKTYEEAFEFYYNLSRLLNCSECILSNALSHTKNKEIRDSLLINYIKLPDVHYKEFAQKLLNDSIIKSLPSKKLLVFNKFYAYIHQGKEIIPVRLSNFKSNGLEPLFDSITHRYEDRTPVLMSKLRDNGLREYMMFQELYNFSLQFIVSKGEKTEIHILDPRYYQLFLNYQVNEIEFINCKYGEFRKSEIDMSAYIEALNNDYESIFNQTKRTRYFQVMISSVREIDSGLIKHIHFGEDNKLKFKKPALGQFFQEIKYQIARKTEKTNELDRLIRNGYEL